MNPTLTVNVATPDIYSALFHIGRDNWQDGHWSRFRQGDNAIMGARLWTRAMPNLPDVYHCILTINNGTLENDGTHKGGVFFDSMAFAVPAGWQIVHLPRYNPLPVGGKHYLASRFHFTRRFLVCKALPSNWMDILCGPQSGQITSRGPLDSHYVCTPNERNVERGTLLSRLTQRSPNIAYNGANPDGSPRWISQVGPIMGLGNVTDAGEQGGQGVVTCLGTDKTVSGGAWHLLLGDLTSERNPIACYNSDGSFATRENALGVDFEYRMDGGKNWIQYIPPFGALDLDAEGHRISEEWHYKHWNADNGCPYRALQESMTRIDRYHYVRAFEDDLEGWMLTGDPACRHRLLLEAEDLRISDTLLDLQGLWSEAHSLKAEIDRAAMNPGKGGAIQRGEAWTAYLGATAMMLTGSSVWTTWCTARAQLAALTQMPSGAMYMGWSQPNGGGSDQGEPWSSFGLSLNKQEAPSWQTPFLITGLSALHRQLGEPPALRDVILKLARSVYMNSCAPVQCEDHPLEQYGPLLGMPRYLVTAIDGVPVPAISEGVGPARIYYDQHALAMAYRLQPNQAWIARMVTLGKPCTNAAAKLADVSAGDPALNAEAQAVLAAYVERHP